MECPNCGSKDLFYHTMSGEYLCNDCGHTFYSSTGIPESLTKTHKNANYGNGRTERKA
jgi:DNA-directed RNA polymerase subunit RPC12/RpoP